MGQELTTFADRPALSTKAAKFFAENKNIPDRETTPTLSIENKVWTVIINGEKTVLQKKDADGDLVALTTMKVIVLDQAPTRGRAYYGQTYDPTKAAMPACWSDDCQTPSSFAKDTPQVDGVAVKSCANCPMSVKGSRKSDNGKESTACSQHQMIAVFPYFAWQAGNFDYEPLRMKLPITSVWDGQNKANDEAGWFAYKNYTDYLRAHGVDHTAMLVTKMKFDSTPGISYPKVLFARDQFLSDEDVDRIVPILQSDKVKKLIGASWTPNGRDGVRTATLSGPSDDAAAAAAKDVTPSNAERAAAIVAERDKEAAAVDAERLAKAEAKKKRIAEAQAALAAAAAEDDDESTTAVVAAIAKAAGAGAAKKTVVDDDDDAVVVPGTAAAAPTQAAGSAKAGAVKAKATAAAAPAAGKAATGPADAAPAGLDDLLGKWGD